MDVYVVFYDYVQLRASLFVAKPLEAEEGYLLFSWSDSKWAHLVHYEEIFIFELELLTPLWQAVLGLCCSAAVHAARLRFMLLGNCSQLLGNSSWWSDHEFDCSALVRTCSNKLKTVLHNGYKALGDYLWGVRPRIPMADHMGCAPKGGPAHKMKPCGARCCSRPTGHRKDILKILRDLL